MFMFIFDALFFLLVSFAFRARHSSLPFWTSFFLSLSELSSFFHDSLYLGRRILSCTNYCRPFHQPTHKNQLSLPLFFLFPPLSHSLFLFEYETKRMMWTWKHEIHKLLATTHSMWYHFDDDELLSLSLSFIRFSLFLSENQLLSMCYLGYLFCIYLLPRVYHHSLIIWFACTNSIGYYSNWMKPIYIFFLRRVKWNEMQCTNIHIAHDVMWLFLSFFFLLLSFFSFSFFSSFSLHFFLTFSPSFVQLWILVFLCFLSLSLSSKNCCFHSYWYPLVHDTHKQPTLYLMTGILMIQPDCQPFLSLSLSSPQSSYLWLSLSVWYIGWFWRAHVTSWFE